MHRFVEGASLKVEDLFWGRGPKLHVHEGAPRSWQVSDEVLALIDRSVGADNTTLETGSGVTTVLFALKGCRHTCIVPFADEVERIRAYCDEHGLSTERMTFVVDRSERALPQMRLEPLDLVLIDGSHGFPVPLIDWYYTADSLRVGGVLVLDDTQLWSVDVLRRFLEREPEWRVELDLWPRSVVLSRVAEGSCAKNEYAQPYVVEQTIDLLYPEHIDMVAPYIRPGLIAERTGSRATLPPRGGSVVQRARRRVRKALRSLEQRI